MRRRRDQMKRVVAQAALCMFDAQQYLFRIEQEFEGVHPEEASALVNAIMALDALDKLLRQWCMQVWGNQPDAWEQWRAGPTDRAMLSKARQELAEEESRNPED